MNRVSCLLLVAIRFLLANDIQSVQTPITPQLSEELSRTSLESFIRINIVMKEQINSDILHSSVQSLSKANRLQFCMWRNVMEVKQWYDKNKVRIDIISDKSHSKLGCGVFIDEFIQILFKKYTH